VWVVVLCLWCRLVVGVLSVPIVVQNFIAAMGFFLSVCSDVSLFGSKVPLLPVACCRKRLLVRVLFPCLPLVHSHSLQLQISLIIFFCYSGFEIVFEFTRSAFISDFVLYLMRLFS
jgi:hypothetical protein